VYGNALLVELIDRGLKSENQVPIKVKYKGTAAPFSLLLSAEENVCVRLCGSVAH